MSWGSASEFFAMGGYGLYVWGSYGAALVVLAAEPWLLARRHRRALAAAADPLAQAAPDHDFQAAALSPAAAQAPQGGTNR